MLEDVPETERAYRHRSKGGWPFSTRAHGWPISDCTAEGVKASLLLETLGLSRVSRERLRWAVDVILSLQNTDGGWATYELQRGPRWLERLNPSDVFSTIMVDVSYVECTSACVQALVAWSKAEPAEAARVRPAIERGLRFIRGVQREDGSWEGSWGVCFSYGAFFGTAALVAGGRGSGRSGAAAGRAVPRGPPASGRQLERDAGGQPGAPLGGGKDRPRGDDIVGAAVAGGVWAARLGGGAARGGVAPGATGAGRPLAAGAHRRGLQQDLRRALRHLPARVSGLGAGGVRVTSSST